MGGTAGGAYRRRALCRILSAMSASQRPHGVLQKPLRASCCSPRKAVGACRTDTLGIGRDDPKAGRVRVGMLVLGVT